MDSNTQKFTGKAAAYDKYRSDYPKAVYEYILKKAGEGCRFADVGAGTGKFAEGLLALGHSVCCVEPNDDMRAKMDARLSHYDGYRSVAASAEHTTLEDGAFDCITAA